MLEEEVGPLLPCVDTTQIAVLARETSKPI